MQTELIERFYQEMTGRSVPCVRATPRLHRSRFSSGLILGTATSDAANQLGGHQLVIFPLWFSRVTL